MINLKKILFTTDFSPCAQRALNHAMFLAESFQSELHMLHVIQTHRHDMVEPMAQVANAEEIYNQLKNNAAGRLQDMIDGKANGIPVHYEVLCGISIVELIIEYISINDIDVVIIGTHGRQGINRFIMGSVAEKIVRLAPCSVLTVRCEEVSELRRIVVPIDFSVFSHKALRVAVEAAWKYNSELHILHIIERHSFPSIYNEGVRRGKDWLHDVKARIQEEVEELLKKLGAEGVKTSLHISEGHPSREIITYAQENNADLIIVATHGLRGINYLLMGSVSEKVVRHSQCPVLTVKSKSIVQYLEEQTQKESA